MRVHIFRRRILTALAVVAISVNGLAGIAWMGTAQAAQTAQVGGNSLKISPVRQSIVANPGTKQTVAVTIQNISSVPAHLHVVLNDFMASADESGTPSILLDENSYAPTHSLKRYMLPVPDFTLPANGNKEVDLVLSIPANAAGGGYFGAIRFEPVNESGIKNLSLSASVGSLILLRVNGDIKEDLTIASFDIRQNGKSGKFFTTNKNLTAVVRFKNGGNVQVEPFGKVLTSKGKADISTTEINDSKPAGSVLPDSVRRFDVRLDKVGPFGKYTVKGNFGYGSTGQLLSVKQAFYVVPVAAMLLGVAIVLAILFLIFGLPRMIRAYNRRVIRRAGRRR